MWNQQATTIAAKALIPCLCILLIFSLTVPALAGNKDIDETAGDIGQWLIPATAYALTFVKGDEEGRSRSNFV